METIEIELTNQKALKLLQDLEDLNLIKVIRRTEKKSSLRGKIQTQMTEKEIDRQLASIRDEWQRAI
ncbi:hypothetical protein [Larkinella terrae]|uniref:Uncharacterized protein n=1 Tax=Larkinella terrae TaxID=2025311 RepID=A0A7K0ERV1_9BACT|nr:hypothetical protein [Larkinella terrae]MRS64489.1 hypothetical protein [Larkinella terrae]